MKTMKNTIIILLLATIINFNFVHGGELSLSSQSSILIDGDTGRIFYEKNSHEKMGMASTTKIMTALLALENGELNDKVRIDSEAVGIEGSSIYLKEGEIISLKDLVYGLMLRSGNDAAVAIASHIGGSSEEFIDLMNKKAKSIGALNTNFTNPNGLSDDNHYSTAYDMALITREAFKQEEFRNIVNSKSYKSNRIENNYFYNKNKTLSEYDGGNGVKTGYTRKSGRCLVSSASRQGLNLISVSLNAPNWFSDNYKLLDYGFETYKPFFIYDKGQFVKKIKIDKGTKEYLDLVTEDGLFFPLKEDEREKIKIHVQSLSDIELPIEKDQIVGSISVYLDSKLINEGNLIAKSSIDKQNIIYRLFNKIKYN